MRWAGLGLLTVLVLAMVPMAAQAADLNADYTWTYAPSSAGSSSDGQFLAADTYYYYYFAVDTDSNFVAFDFEVTAGPNVDVYMLDQANFDAYAAGQTATYIAEGTRENTRQDTLTVYLSSFTSGRHYFVLDNTDTGAATPAGQSVTVSATLENFFTFTYQFVIPETDYQDCQSVPDAKRDDWNKMATVSETPLRDFTNYLDTVRSEYEGWVPADDINIILAFLHSMPNVPVSITAANGANTLLPLETVYLQGGESDDAALLFVTLAKIQGYDVGILEYLDPVHTAGGVNTPTPGGYHWELDGDQYFMAETTGLTWKLGEAPTEYQGQTAYVTKITGGTTCDDITASTIGPTTSPPGPTKEKKGLNKFVSDVVDKALLPIVIGLVLVLGTIGLIFERRQSNKRKARVQQAQMGYTDAPGNPWDAQPMTAPSPEGQPWGYDPASTLGPQEQERLRLLDERFMRGEIDQKTYMKMREQLFKK